MNIITEGPECPACGVGPTHVHTEAEQDHEDGPWDWYCEDGDKVTCGCGAALCIETDDDGQAWVVEVAS